MPAAAGVSRGIRALARITPHLQRVRLVRRARMISGPLPDCGFLLPQTAQTGYTKITVQGDS